MVLRVLYRQQLTEHGARRWTEDHPAPDGIVETIRRLIEDAGERGCEITSIVVEEREITALPAPLTVVEAA